MENNTTTFTSKKFTLWSFHRGSFSFFRKNTVTISDNALTIVEGKYSSTFLLSELECAADEKFFLSRYAKVHVAKKSSADPDLVVDYFYVQKSELARLEATLRENKAFCYSDENLVIRGNGSFFGKMLTGHKPSLWCNKQHLISSEKVMLKEYIDTPEVKYCYTQGKLTEDLYIGASMTQRITFENVNKEVAARVRGYINIFDGGQEASESFSDGWSFKALYNPKYWFIKASIGFNDKGIVYKQKTFKTNDELFLPFDKISFALVNGSWWWPFSKKITIWGEQNIEPLREFPRDAANAISKRLEQAGIKKFEGKAYTASVYSKWQGVIFGVLTLGIWYIIRLAARKISGQNKIMTCNDLMAWSGKVDYPLWDGGDVAGMVNDGKYTFVFSPSCVTEVAFVKRKWYHLWGWLYIMIETDNIRVGHGAASQGEHRRILEMHKIWKGRAEDIINELEKRGFSGTDDGSLRSWAKDYVKKNED